MKKFIHQLYEILLNEKYNKVHNVSPKWTRKRHHQMNYHNGIGICKIKNSTWSLTERSFNLTLHADTYQISRLSFCFFQLRKLNMKFLTYQWSNAQSLEGIKRDSFNSRRFDNMSLLWNELKNKPILYYYFKRNTKDIFLNLFEQIYEDIVEKL